MKQFIVILLAVALTFAAVGCAAPEPKELERVGLPESTAPIPEGLSSASFKLGENTYAFWRILRYPPDGGSTKYEIQVLQKEESVPVTFIIGSDGASSPKSLVHMKIGEPTEEMQTASGTYFSQTEEVPGYAIVISCEFLINAGQSLPETAILFLSDSKTGLNIQGEKLLLNKAIMIDVRSDTSLGTDQTSTPLATAEEENALIQKELVGTWKGSGEPIGGGSPIALDVVVNADATGSYTFEQAGYVESYPFTMANDTDSFSVSIPADNQLGISTCEGSYSYSDGVLTLNITTEFSSGRQFKYVAECVKVTE